MALRNFKPNDKFFEKYGQGPEIKAVLLEVAAKAKVIAESISEDFRSDNNEPGHVHYADSFETSLEQVYVGAHGGAPRAAARLTNTAPHAPAVEWGYKGRADSETSEAHRPLGRTLAALTGETDG